MRSGQVVKAKPIVGSALTSSTHTIDGGAGTSSASLQDATKTVGSEQFAWAPTLIGMLEFAGHS